MTRITRHVLAEAVADILEELGPRVRDGIVVGLSLEWHPNGTARIGYTLAAGAKDPELAVTGVAPEEDER